MVSLNRYGNQEGWPEEGTKKLGWTRENRMKGHRNVDRRLLVRYCWKGNERTLVRLKCEQQYLQSKRAKKKTRIEAMHQKNCLTVPWSKRRKKDGHRQLNGYTPIEWIMIVMSLLILNLHYSWKRNKLSWTKYAAHRALSFNPVKSTAIRVIDDVDICMDHPDAGSGIYDAGCDPRRPFLFWIGKQSESTDD